VLAVAWKSYIVIICMRTQSSRPDWPLLSSLRGIVINVMSRRLHFQVPFSLHMRTYLQMDMRRARIMARPGFDGLEDVWPYVSGEWRA
jgi:hypothetical protein